MKKSIAAELIDGLQELADRLESAEKAIAKKAAIQWRSDLENIPEDRPVLLLYAMSGVYDPDAKGDVPYVSLDKFKDINQKIVTHWAEFAPPTSKKRRKK